MEKTFSRKYWENDPSKTTPLSAANLNEIDYALNEVDDRVILLNTTKAEQSDMLNSVKNIYYSKTNGVFIFEWHNGSTLSVDLNVEKIPTSFEMDENGIIIMTTDDGTVYTADIKAILPVLTFENSDTVSATKMYKRTTIATDFSTYTHEFSEPYTGNIVATVVAPSPGGIMQPVKQFEINYVYSNGLSLNLSGYSLEEEIVLGVKDISKITITTATDNNIILLELEETNSKEVFYKFEVIKGSITEKHLQPNYLADITQQANLAMNASLSAGESANIASQKTKEAESYAHGGTGTRDGEDTDNALYYAQQAKQYRDEAFATTPDGYADLVQNVADNTVKIDTIIEKADLRIKNTATGESIHVTDSADSKVVEFALYGKGKQKRYSGKNLLENTATTTTSNNVTFTVNNDDKSVVINGTSTARTAFTLARNINIPVGSYILSESSEGADGLFHEVSIVNADGEVRYVSGGAYAPLMIDISDGEYISSCHLIVNSGSTLNNVTLYPMISVEGGEYEPYVGGIASPNPKYPQDVEISGASGSVEVKSCGKNEFVLDQSINTDASYFSYASNTQESIIATVNSAGKFIATLKGRLEKGETYTASVNANVGVNIIIYSDKIWGNSVQLIPSVTDNKTFVFEGDTGDYIIGVYITASVSTGTNVNLSKLQLERGSVSTEYQSPKTTKSTILTPNGLAGIPVESGDNYTDENGQQWISDVVYKYADGSGKRIQKCKKYVFDGTEEIGTNDATSGGGIYFYTNAIDDIVNSTNSALKTENAICTHLEENTANVIWGRNENGFAVSEGISNKLRFRMTSVSEITSVATLKTKLAEWHSNGTPVTFWYVLAEPIITDLTAEEIAEIEKLHTFYPVTNISNDADCGMEITYMADAKNYIDNKLAQIESAMLNNI